MTDREKLIQMPDICVYGENCERCPFFDSGICQTDKTNEKKGDKSI